jgi:hypothetical protein
MRYSNLSNNMMISKLWTTITIQIQYVDGWAAHMTDTTLTRAGRAAPYQIMLDRSLYIYMEVNLFWWCKLVKTCFFVNFQVKSKFLDGCLKF